MTYQQTLDYLYTFIPEGKESIFPGGIGLKRTKHLLTLLGNPQNKLTVIHVAGTSGKGSTSFMLSHLLHSHGFRVGLQLSPHLVDIRERFQINNVLISQDEFCESMRILTPLIEDMRNTEFGAPSFFEIIVVLAFFIFHQKNVDYAVMETGLGGLLDATNSVDNPHKLAIITRIGHDHMHILGNTLLEIALQKAGIIGNGNTAIVLKQHSSVMNVIQQYAHTKLAQIIAVTKRKNIDIKMKGQFQKENASLALAAFEYISHRDHFSLNQQAIHQVLQEISFPGRMDIKQIYGKEVIIDGAHNPQKMKALTLSLKVAFPKQKFTFVVAFKKHKNYSEMLRCIVPLARQIILTRFTVTSGQIAAEDPSVIAGILSKMGFTAYTSIPILAVAIKEASIEDPHIVITGSLYLAGEAYQINE